ncbi:hypothetical protein ACWKWC_08695 [Geodermatophilus nigrescens]
MTDTRTQRPSTTAGRSAAAFAIVADGVLLLLLHGWPGWQAVPFLTDDTTRVLPAIDALLVAGILVGLVQLVRPRGATQPAGTLVTTAFGLAATLRTLQVFPFDLDPGWALVARIVLWLGVVGAVVGLVSAFVSLLRLRAVRR